ncbi:MAG: LysR family transcriptional regulator [Pyrinomonadaceae bacterium]
MELRHLRYFLAVAEELHFGKAALRLHIAQPPLSKQIQQLEDELGMQLFKRTRRSVELTEAGKVFQREAYNTLGYLEKGILKAKLASRGEAGWLSVGFIGSSTYEVLPSILREFRQSYPEVELILHEIRSSEQSQALREQRIHVSFARFPKPEQGLVFETIYRENLVVALPQSHHLNRRKSLRLSDIANEPFVLFPHQPSAHSDNTIQVFADAGLTLQIVQTVEEMHTALGLVAAGIGVTLVPSSMQKTQREAIVYLNLAKPETVLELKMGYREDEISTVLKRFIETVHSMASLNLV